MAKHEFYNVASMNREESGIPSRFFDLPRASEFIHDDNLQEIRGYVEMWGMDCLADRPKTSLIIFGENSDFVLSFIMKKAFKRRRKVYCVNSLDVDPECKDNEVMEFFSTVNVLGIYDFPSRRAVEYSNGPSNYDRLLSKRYYNALPTIFASSVGQKEVGDAISRFDRVFQKSVSDMVSIQLKQVGSAK